MAHRVAQRSKRVGSRRGYGKLAGRKRYTASCSCGWSTTCPSRQDRRVEVDKHRETARWERKDAERVRPYGASRAS